LERLLRQCPDEYQLSQVAYTLGRWSLYTMVEDHIEMLVAR
jgi:hypothetical protein